MGMNAESIELDFFKRIYTDSLAISSVLLPQVGISTKHI
jgi:hypothetical protein